MYLVPQSINGMMARGGDKNVDRCTISHLKQRRPICYISLSIPPEERTPFNQTLAFMDIETFFMVARAALFYST